MTDTTIGSGVAGSQSSSEIRLTGKMTTAALMLTVLAFSAPMAVVDGFIPFTIFFGGPGATLAFVFASIALGLFAIGYVTMARHVPKPGDFYAFISSGLGRITGLGAAFLAVFSYLCVLTGSVIFCGISVASVITAFGGPETSWVPWAILAWLAVSILGYLHIEISAKILTWAMVVEVIIVVVYSLCTLAVGGKEGLSAAPFTLKAFSDGDMAVTMLYAILVFMGFEATALFRDEVRDPDKTIPRATYGAVILIGLLYTLACYAMTEAFGSGAWDAAKTDPSGMFATSSAIFVSPLFSKIARCSVALSTFAAIVSIHNVLARYIFNLAIDRALPSSLAAVHSRHHSPHRSSTAAGAVVGLLLLGCYMTGISGSLLYGMVVGIGSIGVIFLMGLVCVAVIGWFAQTGIPKGENAFKVFIAPAMAGTALLSVAIFTALHLHFIVGGEPDANNWIILVLIGVFVLGSGLAIHYKLNRIDLYEKLGRAERIFDAIART
ncbi:MULTISPECIES: APC family permease [unclassified Mesorhizobium]|uniref:APC family permease n=1 Tax=unclassified Mesorhizobium TaxID=325217 RepID=UPI00068413A5|nr:MULTISPECIES: APC family permease [unclassified Mesorhizobium]